MPSGASLRPLTAPERAMVEANMGLVHMVVNKVLGRGADDASRDDATQAGMLGLIHAVQGFDPHRGFAFSTYAVRCIDGYVRSAWNREDKRGYRVRKGIPEPTSLEWMAETVGAERVYTGAHQSHEDDVVTKVTAHGELAKLPPREAEAILALHDKGLVADLAAAEGVSGQAIRVRAASGMAKLRGEIPQHVLDMRNRRARQREERERERERERQSAPGDTAA